MRQNRSMARKLVREFDVVAGNGRQFRAWESKGADSARLAVLLCPELGAIPEVWPGLLPSPEVPVVSWYGSSSPAANPAEHIADALAVLDAAAIQRCVVVGWSVGSVVALGLAHHAPDRVRGVMVLGGAPGALLDDLLALVGIPKLARRALAEGGARSLQLIGPRLTSATRRLPVSELSTRVMRAAALSGADPVTFSGALRRFIQSEWLWFSTLALAVGGTSHARVADLTCPLTALAGRYDPLSTVSSIVRPIAAFPQTRLRFLPTSHLLPLEAPEEVGRELALLLDRAAAVGYAQQGVEPPHAGLRR
jgi:pimeloyl-ACP methyl ester carboxylesterase